MDGKQVPEHLQWQNTAGGEQHHYDYTYDALGRLTDALYSSSANNTTGRYDEQVTYNANGSITSLLRNGMKNDGTFGTIDDLTITYNGNRLLKVTDDAEALNYNSALDFNDGDDSDREYQYDSNGALTKDSNRGITSITYDYGHHLQKIAMSAQKKDIVNDYTPDGRKLSSRHLAYISKGNGSYRRITTTDLYIDGLILRGGSPLMWLFDGGYVDLDDNGAPTGWNYYVTDHLGSTRKVVDCNDSIRETISYYPFGSEMRMQDPSQMTGDFQHPYRFTGKELDRLNGLNMYDFGARWYDVAGVPMWTSVDSLAEKYYNVSPYVYCMNNPIMLVDPNGMEVYGDSVSQLNIRNTLTEEENKYVDFNSNGLLNYERLCQFKGSSANMDALKLMAKSEIVYSFESKECDSEGKPFVDNNNDFYRGVTEIPGAQTHPSMDEHVHIIVGSTLSKEQQAKTIAHEGFGHGYLYEITRDAYSASHHYENKQGAPYIYNGIRYYELIRYDSNVKLNNQIERVVKETTINFHNKFPSNE